MTNSKEQQLNLRVTRFAGLNRVNSQSRTRANRMTNPMLNGVRVSRWQVFGLAFAFLLLFLASPSLGDDALTAEQLAKVRELEQKRVAAINKVYHSVVAVYGDDRQGGGSGVIIDPSGLALTNHHVIMGAGVSGWGGLADGKLYRWKLIGTDPGGDVAIIQLEGKEEFPYSILADSDTVRVGDWSLAMGNPFILAEDQTPTVTLGIVSGVKRYQYGQGNQLVYGNCIQTDSSINPGNSGGPLFNLQGEVIGINGRGSFEERGRVNVGLGYAISSNQIRNFIPDLLATKLVEHGTLDAVFGNRSGGVLCETINSNAPVAKLGLGLGDRLIEFEGEPITNANQFTNLICTLPEDWPAQLTIEKTNGEQQTLWVNLMGLPYNPPPPPREQPKREGEEEPTPAQKKMMEKQAAMQRLLSSPPGEPTNEELNRTNALRILGRWQSHARQLTSSEIVAFRFHDEIIQSGSVVGHQTIVFDRQGRFRLTIESSDQSLASREYVGNGGVVWESKSDGSFKEMRQTKALDEPFLVQLLPYVSLFDEQPMSRFGKIWLDGSGKAQRETSQRIKTIDENGNWFYVWLSLPRDEPVDAIRMLKASIDRNGENGAVTFDSWNRVEGLHWPEQRRVVFGFEEAERYRMVTKQAEAMTKVDSAWFETTIQQ